MGEVKRILDVGIKEIPYQVWLSSPLGLCQRKVHPKRIRLLSVPPPQTSQDWRLCSRFCCNCHRILLTLSCLPSWFGVCMQVLLLTFSFIPLISEGTTSSGPASPIRTSAVLFQRHLVRACQLTKNTPSTSIHGAHEAESHGVFAR